MPAEHSRRIETLNLVSCFPPHFFRTLPLPACFTTEQSIVKVSIDILFRSLMVMRTCTHTLYPLIQSALSSAHFSHSFPLPSFPYLLLLTRLCDRGSDHLFVLITRHGWRLSVNRSLNPASISTFKSRT